MVSFCVGLLYWVYVNHIQRPMLCSSQQKIAYSRANTTRKFSGVCDKDNSEYCKALHEILVSYQQYHAIQRERLVAGKASKRLTWYCISDCAGIGDRMKGMYLAFLLALVTNRTFFIYQSVEIQSTMLLEPNEIDWKPIEGCTVLANHQTLDNYGRPSMMQSMLFGTRNDLIADLNRLNNSDSIFLSGKKRFFNFIHSIISDSTLVQNPVLHKLLLHVLQLKNGIRLHYMLSTVHQFLFHTLPQVEHLTKLTLKELNLEPQKYVAVQIRTGFKNSFLGEIMISKTFFEGVRFARTEQSWRQMIECAIKISDQKFGKNSTLLIAADDQEPKDWAAAEYMSRVTMLNIKPVHVDLTTTKFLGMFTSSESSQDAYLNTWTELSVISQSAAIVSIHSGFTEVASHMGPIPPFSFYYYNISNKKCACITQTIEWAKII